MVTVVHRTAMGNMRSSRTRGILYQLQKFIVLVLLNIASILFKLVIFQLMNELLFTREIFKSNFESNYTKGNLGSLVPKNVCFAHFNELIEL